MTLLKRLLYDRSGNFGLMTALLAVPLIGTVGIVIDYSHASDVRTRLMGAADAAALGAIAERSTGYVAAEEMATDGRVGIAENNGLQIFLSNTSNFMSIAPHAVSVTVRKDGEKVTSTISFSVDVPTYFLTVFGRRSITVAGTAKATFAAGGTVYADYHLLLDNSPSMGLGATKKDISALIAATANKCAFACHEVWNSGVEKADSNYNVARRQGITLRIDVLRQAAVDMIDHARDLQGSSNHFQFSAYSFGKAALQSGHKINRLSGLTTDLASFRKSVNDVTLMSTPNSTYAEDALTSFDSSLAQLGKEIKPDGGSGKSTTDREQVVMLVTDGVGNSIKPRGCTGFYSGKLGRCIEPIDLSYCEEIKKRGIKIAVLYTTYVAIDDHLYNTYVKKFATQIGPKLKACASQDLYSEVGIEGDMKAAMKKLFGKAAAAMQLRLAS